MNTSEQTANNTPRTGGIRRAITIGLVGAMLAGGLVASATAFGGHRDRAGATDRMGGDRFVERMAERLDLSDAQVDSIRGVIDGSREERRTLRDQIRDTRGQIRASMENGVLDESSLRPLAESQGDAMAQMIVLRARVRANVHALLTDEQRERFEQMRGERRGRRR